MSDSELKARLLKGLDIDYQGILIKNYSIGEIFEDLGLDRYYYLAGLTTANVEDLVVGSDLDKLTVYKLFCNELQFRQHFIEFLNTFTYLKWEYGLMKDFVAYDENKKRFRINEDKFDGLMKLIKKMYSISRGEKKLSDEIDPNLATSPEAREFAEELIEDAKENSKKKNKNGITLMGIINGICSKGIGYTLFNIWDLKVYQVMAQYYGIEQDEIYKYTMTSIYTGVYDTKKNKFNINDIHWAKEVDV